MRYWLMKTEPDAFSWDDLVAKGYAGEEWDGVRNYQARNMMRDMAIGDRAFVYHSQSDKAVIGIAEVITTAHPDSTTDDRRWECVDIRAVSKLKQPVTLEMCKNDPRLSEMALLKQARLSVQPVRAKDWAVICELGGGV